MYPPKIGLKTGKTSTSHMGFRPKPISGKHGGKREVGSSLGERHLKLPLSVRVVDIDPMVYSGAFVLVSE